MARRATYISDNSTDSSLPLLVDGGDILDGPDTLSSIQGRFMYEAMAYMGYQALGIGHRDLQLGQEWLRDTAQDWGLNLTSANLVWTESGEPVFDPYLIVGLGEGSLFGGRFGGQKVGVISVMGTDKTLVGDPDDLSLRDAKAAVVSVLQEVTARSDVVVVLAQTTLEEGVSILETDGVDALIICRYDRQSSRAAMDTQGGVLAGSYHSGRKVGWFELELGDSRPTPAEAKNDFLSDEIGDEPQMAALITRYLEASAPFAEPVPEAHPPEPLTFGSEQLRQPEQAHAKQ